MAAGRRVVGALSRKGTRMSNPGMMTFPEAGVRNISGMEIGNKIRKRREVLELSRKSVAEASGIHVASISRWETRGLPAYMPRHEVRQLERVLKVRAGWLFAEEEATPSDDPRIGPGATLQSSLQAAGDRARMRREQLGIARSHLAFKIEVRDLTLRQWENHGIPQGLSADKLDAWEKALQVEPGWLLGKEAIATQASPQDLPEQLVASYGTAAEVILEVGRIYAQSTAKRAERNASLFAMRYGVNAGGRTLAAIAAEHGITESRACQILGVMRNRAPALPDGLAAIFERIDATAKQHLPCAPEHLEAVLRPLLGDGPSIEDAWRFARDVFGKLLLSLETHLYDDSSVAPVEDERLAIVLGMAQSMISAVGAAHVGVLIGYAIEQGWSIEAVSSMKEMLQAGRGFEWLDRRERKSPEWFWYGETLHNPVVTALRRVCAIAEVPIVTDVAMGAVERMRELRLSREERSSTQYPVPPGFIITAILSRLRFLAGSAGRFRPAVPLDPKTELPEQEYRLYQAFRRLGYSTTWEALAGDLVDTGEMSETTLRALLSRSPIVATQSPGVYVLRGTTARVAVPASTAADVQSGGKGANGEKRPARDAEPGFERDDAAGSSWRYSSRGSGEVSAAIAGN
jgi:transcriptional regulator with XRE-family HTH domain